MSTPGDYEPPQAPIEVDDDDPRFDVDGNFIEGDDIQPEDETYGGMKFSS